MSVSAILAEKGRKVVTANTNTTIKDIIKTLAEKKIGAAVVLSDQEQVCGIVSERDVVREIARSGASVLDEPVSTCMTNKVVSCGEHDSIDELMEKMTQGRFRHLPVIDNDKLTGIISIGDVVKRKIRQAELDAEDMKRYIAG